MDFAHPQYDLHREFEDDTHAAVFSLVDGWSVPRKLQSLTLSSVAKHGFTYSLVSFGKTDLPWKNRGPRNENPNKTGDSGMYTPWVVV